MIFLSSRGIKISFSNKYFFLLVILFISMIILYVKTYITFQTLIASIFAIFFFVISVQLYFSIKTAEKDSESMNQTMRYFISSFVSGSIDKFAYKVSAISAMFFLTAFIFISLIDDLSLSNIMQDLAIIGGTFALHIFYIIDKTSSEPSFLETPLIVNLKQADNGKLIRTEAVIVTLSTIHETELSGIEIIASGLEQNSPTFKIIYVTSVEKSDLEIGDKIRILGNWYCESNSYLINLGLKDHKFPFILIIDGYGVLEEVPFLTKELIHKLTLKE